MESDSEFEMSDVGSEQGDEAEDQFLTTSELEEEMEGTISDVQSILEVSRGSCRILLRKHKWNKEHLMEHFHDFSSLETTELLVAASNDGECPICCGVGSLSSLSCNHSACDICWEAYLSQRIVAGVGGIECMANGCKLLAEDEKLTHTDNHPITCPCGCTFCFSCGENWHAPVSCRLLRIWNLRCIDDTESFNWINANTKDCPNCNKHIEKAGGCNKIMCQSCRFLFCWMCLKNWDAHGYSPCNSFEVKSAKDAREQSRFDLNRYLFYYNRFLGHQRTQSKVQVKMEQLQKRSTMTWIDVQFLPDAIEVLSACRRTMIYTYVFAFYLERNDNQSLIFESNQKDLEMATEQLSAILEQQLDLSGDVRMLKLKVQDTCRYVDHRRKLLLGHCTEGTDQGIWKFSE
ncbi:Protein CBG07133 [Caenorhabditis briggsae]|uniref:RBR-type E3 ubiquitin transferase n=1 Tax=Caenorhabditis briggsae TaxID=6238 RepID=A8X3M7_CAEBR|nr:Protein CBG07133 [Caenorhabditis briggsae]CAP27237.2 Protein CBG07133 [Caenorhabditis briggsae]